MCQYKSSWHVGRESRAWVCAIALAMGIDIDKKFVEWNISKNYMLKATYVFLIINKGNEVKARAETRLLRLFSVLLCNLKKIVAVTTNVAF